MGHRDQRHGHSDEPSDLRCGHAPGVDHELGVDVALAGDDSHHPAVGRLDRRDARVLADLCAAAARALDQCECQLAGVDVTVGREICGAEDAVSGHRREHALRVLRRDELEWQPKGLRPACLARQLLHALGARSQPQRADLMPARLEADLLAESSVEVDRVHHHLRQAERAAQLADQPGGVEGRAACDPRPFHQHGVGPAQSCQPVEDRRAADTAADDDGARLTSHAPLPNPPPTRGEGIRSGDFRRRLRPT